ncbi:MAG: dTDP-glucose 4,6-dehydratase [Chlamydiia bacterium]|nr:dTDP-glucose 4,6-dehydratase [Chlamydiia bacterium]MCH9618569.1 dTDP-glucose 4,6-dehydratase [Chlamydiia bacterium]MCH9623892.1 dTDP-glucose 4,6-dehydratase [Chlamydiia bacterium]
MLVNGGKVTKETILVTGGFGFMGSDFIRLLLETTDCYVVNLDALTYAANKDNLIKHPRLSSYVIDICDKGFVEKLFIKHKFTRVVHFAAETHVDRSIGNPEPFLHSNVTGTVILLEMIRKYPDTHFHFISTDEVYGDLKCKGGDFKLDSPFQPSSPYAASKASADLYCQAYRRTYKLKITISRSGNNFGPYQNKEKLIPTMIHKAIKGEPLPVYGDGLNMRDWIYVRDHSKTIWKILEKRDFGQIYHVGSGQEKTNIEVCNQICKEVSTQMGKETKSEIAFVEDRMGHDFRYSLDVSKTKIDLGFTYQVEFNDGIAYIVEHILKEHFS